MERILKDSSFNQIKPKINVLLKAKKQINGRKRLRHDDLTKKNVAKILRNSVIKIPFDSNFLIFSFFNLKGQTYISHSTNEFIEGKEFCLISDCCSKKCFEKFDEENQKEIFENFWLTANYNKQNYLLYGLMKRN